MQASRQACRRRFQLAAWAVVALTAFFKSVQAGLAQPVTVNPNPDWPCQQILVRQLSVAAVWSGPPIEGVAWRTDPAVAGLVAKAAARRNTLEDAEGAIEAFARSQGADKTKKLTALFAGLFETLNDERSQIIEGLLRFGAKQKELADKIRAGNALAREAPGKSPLDASGQNARTAAQDLEWDLRVFEERHQSLTYVCETPALIEQRLFALAKIVQRILD